MVKKTDEVRIRAEDVPDTAKHAARKALEKMASEANRKGGYIEVANKLETLTGGLASYLLSIAIQAVDLGKNSLPLGLKYFGALCNDAETHIKAREEVDNIKDVIPCYPAIKSTIRAAMDAGFSPKDFTGDDGKTPSYYALRKALQDKRRDEGRAPHRNDTGEGEEGGTAEPTVALTAQAEGGTGKVRVTPTLLGVINVMTRAINGMDNDTQDKFAEKLAALVAKFAPAVKEDAKAAAKGEEPAPAADREVA